MADGSQQSGFNFPRKALVSALRPGEIVVDLFAGGGGASEALKQALGRDPDLAYNHDELAVGLHAANHPFTVHKREDIWVADPRREVGLRPVGWFHASPDCTHFSQAKGGQPRSRATRSLSWVVLKWAGSLARTGNAPRIISLENVEQILSWGPLIAKRCKTTGRVMKLDGTVVAPGEQVSVWNQALVPDKRYAGRTWAQFVAALRVLGYVVEWRKLIASDYGAGTSRKRLFLIARRDGDPIVWPAPTHGKAPGLLPLVTAADCIDFSVPCPSIFTRKKPLADATMRRIAKGLKRYVIDAAEPFIVYGDKLAGAPTGEIRERECLVDDRWTSGRPNVRTATTDVAARRDRLRHERAGNKVRRASVPLQPVPRDDLCGTDFTGHEARGSNPPSPHLDRSGQDHRNLDVAIAPLITEHANTSHQSGAFSPAEPLRTICANVKGGHFALAAAHLIKFRGDSQGSGADQPMPTITSGAGAARPAGAAHAMGVITAFLEQANGGYYEGAGNDLRKPAPTICGTGSQQRLTTAHLAKLRGTSNAADVADPLHTISAGGEHHALIECTLSPEHEAGALRVAAFLIKYYGTAHGVDIVDPLDTITTRDRLALVTVLVQGTPYVIVDIGLRMLRREELFRAQGFPADYIIDRTADGKPLSISASVRMVGNSVSPPPLAAIARANLDPVQMPERIAA